MSNPTTLFRIVPLAMLIAVVSLLPSADAQAGCGCDHPAPPAAPVMPPFASPGTTIEVNFETASLTVGEEIEVTFTGTRGRDQEVDGLVVSSNAVRVSVPGGLRTGPVSISVESGGTIHALDDSLFTALAAPRRMPRGNSISMLDRFRGAVGRDGTLYIPIDLSGVRDPMQFAFVLGDKPMRFTAQDVVFYNRDGVDLTIFELAVTDPTQRQWGSYYGWDVEQDGGLFGTIYESKIEGSPEPLSTKSDLLTYWRHEFHTYADAHAEGGTHEVDENGFHPDGTRHIDHDNVIIAIRGTLNGQPLRPGRLRADVVSATIKSADPIEPGLISGLVYLSDAFDDDDDDND